MNSYQVTALIILFLIGLMGTAYTLSATEERPVLTVVYIGEKGDFGFLDASFRGLHQAQEEFGFDIREIQRDQSPDADPVISPEGISSDLVVMLGGMMIGYTEEVQQRYPDTRIILIDAEPASGQNTRSVSFDMAGASYLAGILAAYQTQAGIVGVIGAEDAPVIHSYTDGFVAGVYRDRPDIRVITSYLADDAAGYTMQEEAGSITRWMHEEGADLVFVVAGGSGLGAIRAAEGLSGMHIIGVDSDQSLLSPETVIASVVKNLDWVVYTEVAEAFQGSFTPGAARIGFEEGGASMILNPQLADLNPFIESLQSEAVAIETCNSQP